MNIQPSRMSKDYVRAAHAVILLAGAHLADGETVRNVLCPFCGGGQNQEKAFALTREGYVFKYCCHRASCGEKGRVNKNGSFIDETRQADSSQSLVAKPRILRDPLMAIPLVRIQYLINKYGFTSQDLYKAGISWEPQTKRYVVPVRSPYGVHRGYMLRSPFTIPKWDAYQEDIADPWCAWYAPTMQDFVNEAKRPVVIVEDQLSAIKVARQFVCCSLLGTDLNYQKSAELLEIGGPWIMALDADAYNKSIHQMHQWRFYFGDDIQVVKLVRDLKFEPDEAIRHIVLGAV